MKIFLSYASEDADIVTGTYRYLRDVDLDPWMDKFDIPGGADWEQEISKNLADSDVFVVFLSPRSVSKRGVFQKEIKIALREIEKRLADDIYIVPIRMEQANVPDPLSRFQWIDFDASDWRRRLLKSVEIAARKLGQPLQIDKFVSDEIALDTVDLNESLNDGATKVLSVEAQYPLIKAGMDPADMRDVNAMLQARVHELTVAYRSDALEHAGNTQPPAVSSFDHLSYLWIGFEPALVDKDIVSIAFNISTYNAGAAHPQHAWAPINLLIAPVRSIRLHDVLDVADRNDFVDLVLEGLRRYLNEEVDVEDKLADIAAVRDLLLELPNFDDISEDVKFTIDKDGLTVLFDPYEIGSYAMGMLKAPIPWQRISTFARSDSRVWKTLKQRLSIA